jgi:hypothetical protein
MLLDITTMKDVKTFIEQIAEEIDKFYPLKDFKDYVYPDTYNRRYTDDEAENRNTALEKCISVSTRYKPDPFTYLYNLFLETTAQTIGASY